MTSKYLKITIILSGLLCASTYCGETDALQGVKAMFAQERSELARDIGALLSINPEYIMVEDDPPFLSLWKRHGRAKTFSEARIDLTYTSPHGVRSIGSLIYGFKFTYDSIWPDRQDKRTIRLIDVGIGYHWDQEKGAIAKILTSFFDTAIAPHFTRRALEDKRKLYMAHLAS